MPDAQYRPLREAESGGEAPAAPARGVRRLLVQCLGDHGLDQCVADRSGRARTLLILQAPYAAREESCAPFADCLWRDPEALRALPIRVARVATEHDPCPHGQPAVRAVPRPLLELLLLVARQGQRLEWRPTLHDVVRFTSGV